MSADAEASVQEQAEFVGTSTSIVVIPRADMYRSIPGKTVGITQALFRGTYPLDTAGPGTFFSSSYPNGVPTSTTTFNLENLRSSGGDTGPHFMTVCATTGSITCDPGSTDEIYWLQFDRIGANNWTTSVAPPLPSNSTRILDVQPDATTTLSTTFDASVDYFFNSSELTSEYGYEVCLKIQSGEYLSFTDDTNTYYFECTDVVTTGESTWELDDITLDAGLYQSNAYIQEKYTTAAIVSRPAQFIVVSTSIPVFWDAPAGTASTTGSATEFCAVQEEDTGGFFDSVNPFRVAKTAVCWLIDGYKQVFQYLWYPSPQSLNQFGDISIANRFPFVYAYQTGSILEDLFTTDNGEDFTVSASTTIGTIVFISPAMIEQWQPIPGFIKFFVTGIIWYMFVMYCYYKILRIHDK